LGLVEDSNSDESSKKSVTFEETLGVFLFKGQKLTGSLSDLGEDELDSPDFSLVSETELSNQFQLGVKSFLLERSFWFTEGLSILTEVSAIFRNVSRVALQVRKGILGPSSLCFERLI